LTCSGGGSNNVICLNIKLSVFYVELDNKISIILVGLFVQVMALIITVEFVLNVILLAGPV
jgi:hypothetical protein